MNHESRVRLTISSLATALVAVAAGADVPTAQWGGSPSRNNAVEARNLPAQWDVGKLDPRTGAWSPESAQAIQWVARLGSESYGSPVVAGGKVFCATNNDGAHLSRYPAKVDLGCLLAFRQSDGQFLWQHSVEKLRGGRMIDYPKQGICSTPLVEGDRLWIVTNRAEVVCLDTEGFRDGENDGPFRSEPSEAEDESDVVWKFDMMGELGSVQHYMACCSVTSAGDLVFASTSNGVDANDEKVPAPEAPSFIALHKHTGKLVWADNAPGANILDGQWSSPAFGVLGGVPQVIFAGGDGWLYSFLARATDDGKPQLLWKFDCNPKRSEWSRGDRNIIIATPVIHDGRVYAVTGRDPEEGEDQGDLWCIDPTKRGDVSAELVVDREDDPVPPRRLKAVDEEKGERVVANSNSAALWHYQGYDANGDGKLDFEETMHRSLGGVAIQGDVLVIGDFAGLVHCLDPRSGRVHWTYDMLAAIWGSPLIADGKIYLGDEDGDLAVFELSTERNLLAENNMGNSVYSSPTAVDDVLYVSTRSHVFAIRQAPPEQDPWEQIAPYFSPPEPWKDERGGYRSPLQFADGTMVESADDWQRRRAEILATWHDLMGPWPPLITDPKVEVLESARRENFEQLRIRFEWAPGEMTIGYLLIPDGDRPLPAVVTVYYEPETAIGLGKPYRDFAYQLARRGFVALSLGTTEATEARTYGIYYPDIDSAQVQPLSMLACAAANAWYVLAQRSEVDAERIGIVGHSFGGKWAMFASCLFDKYACAVWSDPGIVFDESRPSVNYWEPWYLGYHPRPWRKRGVITDENPARGLYPRLVAAGRDLHELHALMAPRPFLVSGGSEDPPKRWAALNHTIAVNRLLGHTDRVAMTNRPEHSPNEESNAQVYAFFEHFLKTSERGTQVPD